MSTLSVPVPDQRFRLKELQRYNAATLQENILVPETASFAQFNDTTIVRSAQVSIEI
jgi:hypothetical protein